MQAIFRLSDIVVNYFLAFFRVLFHVLGQNSSVGTDIARHLISSLHAARKFYNKMEFQKYLVCRKCHKLYYFADCIVTWGLKCLFRAYLIGLLFSVAAISGSKESKIVL